MNQLISIIVPVYNVEKYVLKCLNSIKEQTYENLEIIIVDDGSEDNSGKICDEFIDNNKSARVFHKKNGGLSSARNYGIRKAKGEIIAFIDSDDYVEKTFISDMYERMIKNDADIVVCGYDDVRPSEENISGKEATIRLLTKQNNLEILTWNKLYKKSLFIDNNIVFPIGIIHEDTLTTYKLLSKAKRVSYIAKSLYVYTTREESITRSEKIEERLQIREQAAKESIDYFKDDADLRKAAEVGLLWAKYNYLNYAIWGKIDRKYEKETRNWLRLHREEYKSNPYLNKKLRIYNTLSTVFNGNLYKIFKRFAKTKV